MKTEPKVADIYAQEKTEALANEILQGQWSKWDNVNTSIPEEMKDTSEVDVGGDIGEVPVDPGNQSKPAEPEYEDEDACLLDDMFSAMLEAVLENLRKKKKRKS